MKPLHNKTSTESETRAQRVSGSSLIHICGIVWINKLPLLFCGGGLAVRTPSSKLAQAGKGHSSYIRTNSHSAGIVGILEYDRVKYAAHVPRAFHILVISSSLLGIYVVTYIPQQQRAKNTNWSENGESKGFQLHEVVNNAVARIQIFPQDIIVLVFHIYWKVLNPDIEPEIAAVKGD